MPNVFETIKSSVSIEELLKKLSIRYTKSGHTLNLYSEGKVTDGWKADINTGVISDFTGKWRPAGDRITFIEKYFWINRAEAIKWFEDNFWIKGNWWSPPKNISNPIKDKWDNLPWLSPQSIEYLRSRDIDYSLLSGVIKQNWYNIALPIRSLDNIKSITWRSISTEWSRYYVEANTDSDWIFYSNLNYDKDYVFIVEWFTDYLSLRQFDTNVIWLVNSGNIQQILYTKELVKKFKKVYLCPDNDEAWQKVIKAFDDHAIKYNLFGLNPYWVWDINELLVSFNLWDSIIEAIKLESIPPKSSLRLALERAKWYKRLYEENWGRLWFTTWYDLIDKYTDWFIKWKVYLIMAFSNYWKTRFAYSLLRSLIKQKKSIRFYSLEVDTWMLFIELIWAVFGIDKNEVMKKLEDLDISNIEDYISLHDEIRRLEDIEKDIYANKPDIAIIDFVQNIEHSGSEYEKLSEIAVRIQKLAILTGTTIIPLSQVGNESRFAEGNSIMPKWSGALFASSDVIFSLWGKNNEKYLTINKNKYWKAGVNFLVEPNYAISEFNLSEDIFSDWVISKY